MSNEEYIENQYRKIENFKNCNYIDLYKAFSFEKMQLLFSTAHGLLNQNYEKMNTRLPTKENSAHFWAEESRNLRLIIEIIRNMQEEFQGTQYAFKLDEYYEEIFKKSEKFLCSSGGSEIPPHMEKINIYHTKPIFIKLVSINLKNNCNKNIKLKQIGEGSYAKVFSFFDPFYERRFVLKRAKINLTEKELIRFKQEFEQMKALSSPYIVDVYRYDQAQNEYIMEYMDSTLQKYIENNNSTLTRENRKSIINQILRAFEYIHSKDLLHRDISPKNILIKEYEDINVIKIADFGLVKVSNSELTTVNTEMKGYFNDPDLVTEGFCNYGILHETYALTKIVYFVMTGRTNTTNIKNQAISTLVRKGLSVDKKERYQSVEELKNAVKLL